MRDIKNITVNYDNGEIETLNKGVVVGFDEIDNEEETIKVSYRMCDIKGKDLCSQYSCYCVGTETWYA